MRHGLATHVAGVGGLLGLTLIASSPAASQQPQVVPHIDTTTFDSRISPCEDFYAYVNGRWLKRPPPPPDSTAAELTWNMMLMRVTRSWGETELTYRTRATWLQLLEHARLAAPTTDDPGTRVGPPRQLLSGPALDQCERTRGPDEAHLCVADTADARHVVDSLKAAGADIIKTYQLRRQLYFVIAAEARRIGIPFGGHLDWRDETASNTAPDSGASAIQASDSGASILDHPNSAGDLGMRCIGDAASAEACQPVAARLRRNGTWWVPTLSIEAMRALVREVPLKQVGRTQGILIGRQLYGAVSQAIFERFYQFTTEFWTGSVQHLAGLRDSAGTGSRSQITRGSSPADSDGLLSVAHRVGLPILAGTDVFDPIENHILPGFALYAELAAYVAEGLTPLEALQTATLNPAKLLHGTDSLGTVAPGKLADLVLLDADPLVDITNTTTIRAVVANGRYYGRAVLDSLLAQLQATVKRNGLPQ